MELSKEFIEAMNGVLNGEKWRRKFWHNKNYFNYLNPEGKFVATELGFTYERGANPSMNDMTATDWERVE